MFLTQFIGYMFLIVASISSSVSMNFQKLAHYELEYIDPRTRLQKRATPVKTSIFLRPLFIIAIFLCICCFYDGFFSIDVVATNDRWYLWRGVYHY